MMEKKTEMTLSSGELRRYARHLSLPAFGLTGQQKLKAARVLVVGAGGLGSPLLLYLAAAGIGEIGIVDFDRIDETNLQRQILYQLGEVGRMKAETAREKVTALNPHVKVKVFNTPFTRENAREIIQDYDVVADGTDNFPTRYLVNDACVLAGKVNVYASIFRFEGQVSVFNYLSPNGERGPNYRDIFPSPPPPDLVPNCAEGGVLGVLPGIIGSMQACEVIKVIAGIGEPLSGKLFLFDAETFTSRILRIRKNPATRIQELIDYEAFCNPARPHETTVQEISPPALHRRLMQGDPLHLIDVREAYELDIANIGGTHLPLGRIESLADQIDPDRETVVYCRSGKRSRQAIEKLQTIFPGGRFYNLQGGILAWADQVDQTMNKY